MQYILLFLSYGVVFWWDVLHQKDKQLGKVIFYFLILLTSLVINMLMVAKVKIPTIADLIEYIPVL